MTRQHDTGRRAGRTAGLFVTLGLVIAACGSGLGTPGQSATPTVGVPTDPAPLPAAVLETVDGVVAGTLGSYTVDGRGSDAPWYPFDSLPVLTLAADATVVVRFLDGAAIGQAIAVIAAAEDATGTAPRGVPAEPVEANAGGVAVGPLPAGRWVLAVRLFRQDGRGEGQTYWAITVP